MRGFELCIHASIEPAEYGTSILWVILSLSPMQNSPVRKAESFDQNGPEETWKSLGNPSP